MNSRVRAGTENLYAGQKAGIPKGVQAALLMGLLLFVVRFTGCTAKNSKVSASGYALNTYVTVTIYGMDEDEAYRIAQAAVAICSEYELTFSRTDAESELYKLNAGGRMQVSDSLYELMSGALYWCEDTDGAVNIAVGSISSIWEFVTPPYKVPAKEELDNALKNADYRGIGLEADNYINTNGAVIDLGAVAKGYIADRIKEYLMENGVKSAIIDLGGSILCVGGKLEGKQEKNFTLGIQRPFSESGEVIAKVGLMDMSLVTSGCYQRYFTQNDIFYHHILDSTTGMPVDNGLLSVTIIARESLAADALSTACFVMGLEAGMEYIDGLEDIYAVFVTEDYKVHLSQGAEKYVTILE